MAIYVGILGIVIIIAGLLFSRPSDKKIDLQKLLYGASFVLSGVCLLFWASLIRVNNGCVGVVKLGGHVQTEILNSGWHLVNPLAKVIKLDTQSQYEIVKEGRYHQVNKDTISIASADGSIIKLGLTVVYHLVPSEAAALYTETGINYKDKLIHPLSLSSVSNEAHIYSAASLSTDKWNELQSNINKDIKSELRKHGVKVEKVLLSNFTPEVKAVEAPEIFLAKNDTKAQEKVPAEVGLKNTNKIKADRKDIVSISKCAPIEVTSIYTKPELRISLNCDNLDELNSLNENIKNNKAINKTAEQKAFASVAKKDNKTTGDCEPMDERSFGTMKKMILSTSDNTYKMLTTAQNVIISNCFTSEQVSDFVKLLPTRDAKLEFAKQAYLRTVDRNEFYDKVADNFDKKTKKRLGNYILHLIHRPGIKTNNDMRAGVMNDESSMLAGVMDDKTFEYFKQMVSTRENDESKLAAARQIANSHVLCSAQVLEIVKLLPDVDSRLQFAKEAFARTTDKRMFVNVANYFDASSRKMLDDYVITLYASR